MFWQTDLIAYLKREMAAVVEEVEAEVDSGSLVDDVSDAEFSEAGNSTSAVDEDDEDSDGDWEFSPKSNPDDDEEYLKALDIDTNFVERYQYIDMSYVDVMPTIVEESEDDEAEEDEPEEALDIDTDFVERYQYIDMSYVDVMPTIVEESEDDEAEEDEPEEKRGQWWSGFDWAEECEWLSGYNWADECEKE